MDRKTRLIVGWSLTVAAALLMVLGVTSTEIGLLAGTTGFLMLATGSQIGRASHKKHS